MKEIPDISIIIVSYNVRDLLNKCIESINRFSSEKFSIEIIIVDNNSSDGSVESVKNKFPDVKVIANNYNGGFSHANNQGIRFSTGKNIFLLNPDTEFNSEILTALNAELTSTNKQIIAPKLLNSDESFQVSCYKFPGLISIIAECFYLHRILQVNNYPVDYFKKTFSTDWASGAALFFSREVYEIIGPLDDNLFWMDDVDYCYRASRKGIKIIYLPEIHIIHHSGKSSESNLSATISNQLISKIKYLQKRHGNIIMIISMVFILIQIFSRIIIFFVLSIFGKSYRKKLSAYLFTLRRFFDFIFSSDNSVSSVS